MKTPRILSVEDALVPLWLRPRQKKKSFRKTTTGIRWSAVGKSR